MFWGLAAGAVDTKVSSSSTSSRDIQSLNEWALEGKLEVTALSLHAYPFVQDRYILLPHGASMGSGYGPVVVAREKMTQEDLADVEIAVPGRMTTAFLLLRLLLGDFRYREVPFDQIIDEVHGGHGRGRPADPRGSADVRVARPAQGRRPRRVVAARDRTAAAARRERRAARPRRGRAPAPVRRARGVDPRRARQPRRGARLRAAVGPRALDEELTDRFVGMYVNELDVRLRRRGPGGRPRAAPPGRGSGAFDHPVRVDFVGAAAA